MGVPGETVDSGLRLGDRAAFAVGDDEEMQRSARPFYPFLCRNVANLCPAMCRKRLLLRLLLRANIDRLCGLRLP